MRQKSQGLRIMNEKEREGTRETIYEREGMLHLPPSFCDR